MSSSSPPIAQPGLLKISQLSAVTGIPTAILRGFYQARKIPCIKLGHRSVFFDLAKVQAALSKFEIQALD